MTSNHQKTTKNHATVLIIIVTYNAMKWADHCFGSIRLSTISCDVFCIDNGSTDGTQDYIRLNYPEVIFTQAQSNLGFGKANNLGLQYVLDNEYQYAYLLNQDAWLLPNTLQELILIAEHHPEYGLLSPMQMKADQKHLEDRFLNVVLRWKAPTLIFLDQLYNHQVADVYEVSFVMAAHWLITRNCIETAGGFSPTFYHYGEDTNYIERVNYWKKRVGIVPSAQAIHDRADSSWNFKKHLYIDWYLPALNRLSNPGSTTTIGREIYKLLKYAVRHQCKPMLSHAFQLWSSRKETIKNRGLSQQERAFLQ